jgi:hypothetical protein
MGGGLLDGGFGFWTGLGGLWTQALAGGSKAAKIQWCITVGGLFLLSLLCLALTTMAVARWVNRSWQDRPPSARQLWLRRRFCTPVFWTSLFQRLQRRKLRTNPILWLQQYSWSARLTCWGWCLAVLLLNGTGRIGSLMSPLRLLAGIAFSAAASFHRERENRTLELLLVTPLTENQIVLGRIWALWKQFLPAGLIMLLSWPLASGPAYSLGYHSLLVYLFPYLALPVFGLYFSLRCKQFFTAWFCTMTAGIAMLNNLLDAILVFGAPFLLMELSATLRHRKFALG